MTILIKNSLNKYVSIGGTTPPPTLEAPTFNGVDQLMRSNQTSVIDITNLDGTVLEGYFESSSTTGTYYSQNISSGSREFQIARLGSTTGALFVGGLQQSFSLPTFNGIYKFEFNATEFIVYQGGMEVERINWSSGGSTEPTATFKIGARGDGSDTTYTSLFQGKTHSHKITAAKHLDYPFDDTFANNPTARNLGVGGTGEFISLTAASWGQR